MRIDITLDFPNHNNSFPPNLLQFNFSQITGAGSSLGLRDNLLSPCRVLLVTLAKNECDVLNYSICT